MSEPIDSLGIELSELAVLTRMIGRTIGSGDLEAIELFARLLYEKARAVTIAAKARAAENSRKE